MARARGHCVQNRLARPHEVVWATGCLPRASWGSPGRLHPKEQRAVLFPRVVCDGGRPRRRTEP